MRERFTERTATGGVTVHNIEGAIRRLAEYEDLQKTPAELIPLFGLYRKVQVNSEDDREFVDFECPSCKMTLQQAPKAARELNIYRYRHCHNCGQKLDWSSALDDFNAWKPGRWR